jgi:hypothetical protein
MTFSVIENFSDINTGIDALKSISTKSQRSFKMLPEKARIYPLTALEAAPVVMNAVLGNRESNDKLWDFRPDPERFTLREAMAHEADWDEIFLGRLKRTVDEDTPTLPDMDETAIAAERNYSSQDPLHNLARWKDNRVALVTYIKSLRNSDFARTGHKAPLGEISVEGWLSLMIGHDMYHIRQAVDYIDSYRSGSADSIHAGWNTTAANSPFNK